VCVTIIWLLMNHDVLFQHCVTMLCILLDHDGLFQMNLNTVLQWFVSYRIMIGYFKWISILCYNDLYPIESWSVISNYSNTVLQSFESYRIMMCYFTWCIISTLCYNDLNLNESWWVISTLCYNHLTIINHFGIFHIVHSLVLIVFLNIQRCV